jgi:hypothetical protein
LRQRAGQLADLLTLSFRRGPLAAAVDLEADRARPGREHRTEEHRRPVRTTAEEDALGTVTEAVDVVGVEAASIEHQRGAARLRANGGDAGGLEADLHLEVPRR